MKPPILKLEPEVFNRWLIGFVLCHFCYTFHFVSQFFLPPGFLKLISPKAKAGKTLLTHQSISPNGLQRPEQFWTNCNIAYQSGLQNPIQAYLILTPPIGHLEWPIKVRAVSDSLHHMFLYISIFMVSMLTIGILTEKFYQSESLLCQ